jgi:hypothetical protein
MHDLPKLQQKLKDTRQEVRNLAVMALHPDLLPAEARAAVKLRKKHLDWVLSQQAKT